MKMMKKDPVVFNNKFDNKLSLFINLNNGFFQRIN